MQPLLAVAFLAVIVYVLGKQMFNGISANSSSVPDATGDSTAPADMSSAPSPDAVDVNQGGQLSFSDAMVGKLAQAWAETEGSLDPNSRGARNNNPGNIEYNSSLVKPGYVLQSAVGSDGRFAIFPTPQAGYDALVEQLRIYAGRGFNILQAASEYLGGNPNAPKVTNQGDPFSKAQTVADALGVSPTTPLSQIFGKGAGATGG